MGEEKERVKIGNEYEYSPNDGTLYHIENVVDKNGDVHEEATPIANHAPLLKVLQIIDDGTELTSVLVFQVLFKGQLSEPITVTLKDILSQTPNLKFPPHCMIFRGRGYKPMYSEAMQMQCVDAPTQKVYTHTGYTVIDGERVFLNGGYSVTKDGLTDRFTVSLQPALQRYGFTPDKDPNRFNTLLELLPKVAPAPVIFACLAMVFISPLNAAFREAKVLEPDFILYLIGRTGSFKTTIGKLHLCFYGDFVSASNAPLNFWCTTNAIETRMNVLDSTLTLLDDRTPSTQPKIKAHEQEVEQTAIRQIGDKASRGRNNADGTGRADKPAKCCLMITGEEAYSGATESDLGRCISVDMKKGDVDKAALTEVQHKAHHLNQCGADYVQWGIVHWEDIVPRIKPMFEEYRAKSQTGGHERIGSSVAYMQMGITFGCEWLLSCNQITAEQAESIKAKTWAIFMELAAGQNKRISEEKPINLFIGAIKEMLEHGEICLVSPEEYAEQLNGKERGRIASMTHDKGAIGCKTADVYAFEPSTIYSKVRDFYMQQDKNFPLSKSTLYNQMKDAGLLFTNKGRTDKAFYLPGGAHPKMLCINPKAFDEKEGD